MRERISAQVSKFFNDEIIMPETIKDYEANFSLGLKTQRAYCVMLADKGIITADDAATLLEGLEYVKNNLKETDIRGEYEDLFFNIESCMIKKTGLKTGGKLHTGRSRNDIGSTLNRLQLRRALISVFDYLIILQTELLARANEEQDVIITGYTHTQPAQPITMGHYFTAVLEALSRDFERLRAAFANTNRCPYGAAAFAGTSFNIDRRLLAKLLGFDGIVENTLDSIASKDFLLETEMAFVNVCVTLSRVAQDMYMWSTDEFSLLEIGGEVSVCSSIMPQKKNPAGLEYVKSKASHSIGALMSCIASLKNTPFSNNIDIHEALWLFDEGFTETKKVLGMMTDCLRFSKINAKNALEKAKKNYCTVTGLADHLVKSTGISFKEAHHIVGTMVMETIDDGGMPAMNAELLKKVSNDYLGWPIEMNEEEVRFHLDPRNNIESKVSEGGPQKSSVEKMIAEAKHQLMEEEEWLRGAKQNLLIADEELDTKERTLRSKKEA